MDGTSKVIDVSKLNTTANGDPDSGTATAAGSASQGNKDTEAAGAKIIPGVFYKYTTNKDGSYNLAYATTYSVASVVVTPNKANLLGGTAPVSSKTILMMGAEGSIKTFTGSANFPTEAASNTALVYYVAETVKTVEAAYTTTASQGTNKTSDYVYIFAGPGSAKDTKDDTQYFTYTAALNGEITTINSTTNASGALSTEAGRLYKLTYNADGRAVLSGDTYASGPAANAYYVDTDVNYAASSNLAVSNGSIIVDSATYALSSDVVYYLINPTTKTVDTISGDVVSVGLKVGTHYTVYLIQKSTTDTSIDKVFIVEMQGA